MDVKIVKSEILGESPVETLADTFGLKLGDSSCICRGCYLNCLSIDLLKPQEANEPCAYLVDKYDKCVVNTAASRSGRIPKFLIEMFSKNKHYSHTDDETDRSQDKPEKSEKMESSAVNDAAEKANPKKATEFEYSKTDSYRIDVQSHWLQ